MEEKEKAMQAFGRLYDIVSELRQKCPWDRKQTFESLRTNTIEEVYELGDAILDGDMDGQVKFVYRTDAIELGE